MFSVDQLDSDATLGLPLMLQPYATHHASQGMDRASHLLGGPANAVLADLQGADPIPNVTSYAFPDEDLDGVVLGLFEGGQGGGRLSVARSSPLSCCARSLTSCRTSWQKPPAGGASRGLPARTTRTPPNPVGMLARPGGGARSSTSACTGWESENSRPPRIPDCPRTLLPLRANRRAPETGEGATRGLPPQFTRAERRNGCPVRLPVHWRALITPLQ